MITANENRKSLTYFFSNSNAAVLTFKLESSQKPQTSANAMLFARWQHHIRFGSGFPYAPLKAMLTKISK